MQAPQHNRPGSGLGVIGELLGRLVTFIIGVIDEFTERSAERRRERKRDLALRRDQATTRASGGTQPPPDHSSDSDMDRTRPPTQDGEPPPEGSQILVSIYLADEPIHAHVEAAVEAWLASAGLAVEERDPPVLGSWFRRLRAGLERAVDSGPAEDVAPTVHAVDIHLSVYQDAQVTALLLQNLGPVIASLQPTKDAVIRAGTAAALC